MTFDPTDWSVDFEARRWQLGFYGRGMAQVILSLDPEAPDALFTELPDGTSGTGLLTGMALTTQGLRLDGPDGSVCITLPQGWDTVPVVAQQIAAKAGLPFTNDAERPDSSATHGDLAQHKS